jgi:hypothetical protein
MAHEEQLGNAAGISRRKLMATGATLAVAGVAVGATGSLVVSGMNDSSNQAGPAPEEPVMVHLKDANSGQLDLFVGTRRLSFTDRGMAAQLAKAAADAS